MAWAEAYLRTKWHLVAMSLKSYGQKIGIRNCRYYKILSKLPVNVWEDIFCQLYDTTNKMMWIADMGIKS